MIILVPIQPELHCSPWDAGTWRVYRELQFSVRHSNIWSFYFSRQQLQLGCHWLLYRCGGSRQIYSSRDNRQWATSLRADVTVPTWCLTIQQRPWWLRAPEDPGEKRWIFERLRGYFVTWAGLTVAPSMSLYRAVAASRFGTAMATWFSLPRLHTVAGGEAEADRDLTELLNRVRDICWNNILGPLKELLFTVRSVKIKNPSQFSFYKDRWVFASLHLRPRCSWLSPGR